MKRCNNNTISVDEIIAVLDHAEQLLSRLASIEFVMTEEEQRGLYSLIRNLDFETWDQDHYHGYEPEASEVRVQSKKLRDLLNSIR
jgi:hypothetical protein